MQKQPRSEYRFLWTAILVVILFLMGSLLFVVSVRRQNEANRLRYLQGATTQCKAAVLQQMDSDFNIMQSAAVFIGELNLEDYGRINTILQEVNQEKTFIRMGLADTKGQLTLLEPDGSQREVDLSQAETYQVALSGREAFSRTRFEERAGQNVNYYTVPVKQKGQVAAVLCATKSGDVFQRIIDKPVLQQDGFFMLVDQNGILQTAPSAQDLQGQDNIFTALPFSQAQKDSILQALKTQQPLHFQLHEAGHNQHFVLEPLGINNWAVISITPTASLSSFTDQTALSSFLLLVIGSAIFIFLMFQQVHHQRKNQDLLEKAAFTDPLTGFRNYAKFLLDAQDQVALQTENYALWSLDIKNFGRINDIFSTFSGDAVLRHLATVLNQTQPQKTLFCRVAADEFAGLYLYKEKADISRWLDQVLDQLDNNQIIPSGDALVDLAMGVYCPQDFAEVLPVDAMVNRAVIAKKSEKRTPGTTFAFFTQSMSDEILWKARMEAEAPEALQKGEITFYLQPKVSLQEQDRIVAAEALARWQHPKQGLISPGKFIPIFEENGFVVELDRHLFYEACKWYAQNLLHRGEDPLRLSINVSRKALMREDFIPYYVGTKNQFEIPDRMIELEFTESVIMQDTLHFQQCILSLQSAGFICSIDDFGSGYSSLTILKNLPIDVLKLDAAFFRDSLDIQREHLVVKSFIEMTHQLGISTVAEGVEHPRQVDFLRYAKCHLIQGYVFSKPLPPQEFLALLSVNEGRLPMQNGQDQP